MGYYKNRLSIFRRPALSWTCCLISIRLFSFLLLLISRQTEIFSINYLYIASFGIRFLLYLILLLIYQKKLLPLVFLLSRQTVIVSINYPYTASFGIRFLLFLILLLICQKNFCPLYFFCMTLVILPLVAPWVYSCI